MEMNRAGRPASRHLPGLCRWERCAFSEWFLLGWNKLQRPARNFACSPFLGPSPPNSLGPEAHLCQSRYILYNIPCSFAGRSSALGSPSTNAENQTPVLSLRRPSIRCFETLIPEVHHIIARSPPSCPKLDPGVMRKWARRSRSDPASLMSRSRRLFGMPFPPPRYS